MFQATTEISKLPFCFRKAAFFPPGIFVKEIKIKFKDCPSQDEILNFQKSDEKKTDICENILQEAKILFSVLHKFFHLEIFEGSFFLK